MRFMVSDDSRECTEAIKKSIRNFVPPVEMVAKDGKV